MFELVAKLAPDVVENAKANRADSVSEETPLLGDKKKVPVSPKNETGLELVREGKGEKPGKKFGLGKGDGYQDGRLKLL